MRHKQAALKKWFKRLTTKDLMARGIPVVLIPGILLAVSLGWKADVLKKANNYRQIKAIFPYKGVVGEVEDGDTFILKSGVRVRLLGMNAPGRGEANYGEAGKFLSNLITNKTVYLEYDRYQDDKYGRVLAWVWMDCETDPIFKPADYMHLTKNTSNPGLNENPKGCRQGKLVNEEMIGVGYAKFVKYEDRGEQKYEKRVMKIGP